MDDSTFLRRASLALNGIQPTADEVRAFINDASSQKRLHKVDELLRRSRYADYWAFRLRQWVRELREVKGQGMDSKTLYFYAREAMGENRSWARIASDLINSQGNIKYDGSANFAVQLSGEPAELGEGTARMFLGVNIACAQCHDHPYVDEWERMSYWRFASYFARMEVKGFGGDKLASR